MPFIYLISQVTPNAHALIVRAFAIERQFSYYALGIINAIAFMIVERNPTAFLAAQYAFVRRDDF